MAFAIERLELCVSYVAENIELGILPKSVEFTDSNRTENVAVSTTEGHISLRQGSCFRLNSAEFGMGRSVTNDLYINSPKISRSHARIIACRDQSYELHDVGGANGTSINGIQLGKHEECKLSDSGEIQLAGIFHLKFTDFGATHVTPDTLTLYGLTLSHSDHRVWLQGEQGDAAVKLSKSEYKFLDKLMTKYPEHATHNELADAIWGWQADSLEDDKRVRDALFNIVKRLRERLHEVDTEHEYIETVRKWGSRMGGYKFHKL